MSGFFAVYSQGGSCVLNIYEATTDLDHLGSAYGGICTNGNLMSPRIHKIQEAPFYVRFANELNNLPGNIGMGVISSSDVQPLPFDTKLGRYAVCVQGNFHNLQEIGNQLKKDGHLFNENTKYRKTVDGQKTDAVRYNKAEIVGNIINTCPSIAEGIQKVWELIDGQGSLNIIILTPEGYYAARDRRGTFPVTIGQKEKNNRKTIAVTNETTCFINLKFEITHELNAGEIVFVSEDGIDILSPGTDDSVVCGFIFNYTYKPNAIVEGQLVEMTRDDDINSTGAEIWKRFSHLYSDEIEYIAGVPDSGTGHAHGTANASGIKFRRCLIKIRAARSYIPASKMIRDRVAHHKIATIPQRIEKNRFILDDDSLVRNTQLRQLVAKIAKCSPQYVALALACPPLMHTCIFEESTRETIELAAPRAIATLENIPIEAVDINKYLKPDTEQYNAMVEEIRKEVNSTAVEEFGQEAINRLLYLTLPQFIQAIGRPLNRTCTYCWDGVISR